MSASTAAFSRSIMLAEYRIGLKAIVGCAFRNDARFAWPRSPADAVAHVRRERRVDDLDRLEVGIGDRDWIRGVVVDHPGNQVAVRVEDAGRMSHRLGGVEVKPGVMVVENPMAWTPCF